MLPVFLMRIQRRRAATELAILLGVCLVVLAITLNVGWIILNWREILPLVLGIPITLLLIAGVVLNTIFLVREVRRNDRQDSFLNTVTHELKTPIASIRLYLETLQRRPLTEEKRQEFYRIMLSDSDRLLSTVEQVLKAGEVTQRNGARGFESLDLRAVASEAVERALERNHLVPEAITLDLPAQALLVNGSMHDLHTAVGNLLGNAIKYSPDGVSISVRAYADDRDRACLEVSDQGIGIPAGELKLIFKRFYRAPMRAVMRRQGTGLGLFLVRSIVKQHGGSVTAGSRGEGLGATFSLRLPLLREGMTAQQELPMYKADA
jgi:two-component system sensor histidine kinase SenX3